MATKRRAVVVTRSVVARRRVASGGARVHGALAGLDADAAHPWRRLNLGRLLLFAFHAFEARLLESHHAAGFTDLRQVHLNALRHIDDPGGTRIVDIAARAGVTKGAMGQLVEQCVRLGLVTLAVDPGDRRARIVSYSARGRRFMAATRRAVARIEREFAALLGAGRFAQLRGDLVRLRDAIDGGAP